MKKLAYHASSSGVHVEIQIKVEAEEEKLWRCQIQTQGRILGFSSKKLQYRSDLRARLRTEAPQVQTIYQVEEGPKGQREFTFPSTEEKLAESSLASGEIVEYLHLAAIPLWVSQGGFKALKAGDRVGLLSHTRTRLLTVEFSGVGKTRWAEDRPTDSEPWILQFQEFGLHLEFDHKQNHLIQGQAQGPGGIGRVTLRLKESE